MNVVYFKLLNGEDIMANLIEENDEYFLIDYPFKFVMNINSSTNILSTSVIRWIPMKDFMIKPLRIIKSNVITFGELSNDIQEYYVSIRTETTKEFERDDYSDVGNVMEDDYEEDEETINELVDAFSGKPKTIH